MTKRILLPIVLAAVAVAQVPPQGQQPQSVAGVVKLNKAPVSNEVLKVKLPRPVEKQLANGLKLLVVESHRVPSISLRISVPSGDLRDPEGVPGISDATASLIRSGTKTRNSKELAETLAELGVSLNFGSAQDSASIFMSSMTENFDAGLEILQDVLLNPTFPQDELDKWKTRQRGNLEQAKSNPGFLGNDLLYKLMYPTDGRQYTHPTAASLEKITREAIIEHYKTYYVPSGEWAGISGDITVKDAVAKLDKVLGAWKGGPLKRVTVPMPAPIAEKKVYLIPRPNSVQTLLIVANRAIDRNSPDYIDAQVMNRVLGSGPSSRLFRIIREEKGYTYGIGSGFNASRTMNLFNASTSVRTDVTEPALAEAVEAVQRYPRSRRPGGRTGRCEERDRCQLRTGPGKFGRGAGPLDGAARIQFSRGLLGHVSRESDGRQARGCAAGGEEIRARRQRPDHRCRRCRKIAELLKKFGPVEEKSPDMN